MVSLTNDLAHTHSTLAIDEALCSDALTAELSRFGFHYMTFNVADDLMHLISSGDLDAIIAQSQYLNQLIKETPIEERTHLLLLIIPEGEQETVDDALLDSVDAVLPASPGLLARQLNSLVALQRKNLSLSTEVTALKEEIETQRRKATEIEVLKNAIVRNVSHELRTPLLQVKSAVALIEEEDVGDQKLINYAQNAVSRLETHVKNITMLGQSLDINIGPIILRDSIDYAKRNLSRTWTRRGEAERIKIHLEENLPPVLADKQGLSTVLQLLIDNAIKFGQDKDVEVIGKKKGDRVYVAVRDHGIGIADSQIKHIFESFYQVDGTSTRPYGGTGVGLALAKLILEYHKVKINVESQLGKGSVFWFELPYVELERSSSS